MKLESQSGPPWVDSAPPVLCRFVVAIMSNCALPERRFVLDTYYPPNPNQNFYMQDPIQHYFDSATDEGIAAALEALIFRVCPAKIFVVDNRDTPLRRPGPACQELLRRYQVLLSGWST